MVVLDKQLETRVRRASKKLGLGEREVIQRAVSNYLGEVEDFISLQHELRKWDVLTAKTIRKHKF